MKKTEPVIPVEIRLTEQQYRVLQIQATKQRLRAEELAQNMVTKLLDQVYEDGIQKY